MPLLPTPTFVLRAVCCAATLALAWNAPAADKQQRHDELLSLATAIHAERLQAGKLERDTALVERYRRLSSELGGDDPGHVFGGSWPLASADLPTSGPRAPEEVPPRPPKCTPSTRVYSSSTPVPIPDAGTANSTINVANAGAALLDVRVYTKIAHTFSADLDVTLTSPEGLVVVLTTDNGNAYDDLFRGTWWDDDADPGGAVPYASNPLLVSDRSFGGNGAVLTLVPEGALGRLLQRPPNGVWTLTVTDDSTGDTGTLENWSLLLSSTDEGHYSQNVVAASTAPLAIPGGPAVVTSSLNVSGVDYVRSLLVDVHVTHTFPGDLDITLTSPAGTIVTLTTDNGSNNSAFLNGTRFWDASSIPVTDASVPAGTTLSAAAPEEAMGAFRGEDGDGTWTLTISDDTAGDAGTLVDWSLNVNAFAHCAVKGSADQGFYPSLYFRNPSTNQHSIWSMDAGGLRTSEHLLEPDPPANLRLVGADNFDLSTNGSELVFHDAATGQVEFWKLHPLNFWQRSGTPIPLTGAAPLPLVWTLSATGDFNNDGSADILWRNGSTQKLELWLMNGTAKLASLVPSPDQAVDANWEVAAALDFDRDTYRDLLWYNPVSGKIVVWFMDGQVHRITGNFTNPPNAGNNNWKVLAGGDYGWGTSGVPDRQDVVWRNTTSGKLVVWFMDSGAPLLSRESAVFTTPDSPSPATAWTLVGPK